MVFSELDQRSHLDVLTPRKVALLGLTLECINRQTNLPVFHAILQFLVRQLEGTEVPQGDLPSLVADLMAMSRDGNEGADMGPVADSLVETLQYLDTPDALCTFIDLVRNLIEAEPGAVPALARDNLLGLFVRRMLLAFDQLSFGGVKTLYDRIRAYASQVPRQRKKEAADVDHYANMSMSLDEMDFPPAPTATEGEGPLEDSSSLSRVDVELFLHRQATMIQNGESGALPPNQLQTKINQSLRLFPDLAQAHFLTYINCIRVREYRGAIDSLHRYLFCLVNRQRDKGATGLAAAGHQYSLLNIAGAHLRLGCPSQAMLVLTECIKIAQEAGDAVCLEHALGWLCRLCGPERAGQLIGHYVARAEELKLPNMVADGHLLAAKNAVQTGQAPTHLQGSLRAHQLAALEAPSDPIRAYEFYALQAAAWTFRGSEALALLCAQQRAPLLDDHGPSTSQMGPGQTVDALSRLAEQHCDDGSYQKAMDLLADAAAACPAPNLESCVWQETLCAAYLDRALHRGDLGAAEDAALRLKSFLVDSDPARHRALPSRIHLLGQECSLAIGRLDTASSLEASESILAESSRQPNNENGVLDVRNVDGCPILAKVAGLKARATSHLVSGNGTGGLASALEAVTLCRNHRYDRELAECIVLLAEIQACMGFHLKAARLLDTMPHILSLSPAAVRAKANRIYAECALRHFTRASDSKEGSPGRDGEENEDVENEVEDEDEDNEVDPIWMAETALRRLKLSADLYSKLEDRAGLVSVFYLQARLFNCLGRTEERDKAATRYVETTRSTQQSS